MRWRGRVAALVVGALVAVLGLSACGTPTAESEARQQCARSADACIEVGIGRPIYVGTLLLETDPSGVDSKRSVALAVDYLDGLFDGVDGQLLGHPVATLDEVDDCTRRGGVRGARRLLLEPDLVAVIGPTCSAAAERAAAVVLSRRSVLLISPSNTSPALTDPETHERFYFRTAFNDLIQGASVANFARNHLGARTAGVIATDEAYSGALGDAFAENFWRQRGTVAARASVPSIDASPAAAVAAMARARPDVIFLPLFEPTCTRAVRAIRSTPALAGTTIIVSEACQSPVILRALGPLADGVYASGPDDSDLQRNDFYRSAFLPAYRQRYGSNPPSVFHAPAWDAVNLLFGAIRRSSVRLPGGALIIDREKVRTAMLDIDGYRGMSGTLTCVPTGDCAQSARIAVYRAPRWPQVDEGAKPVFSQALTLAEVTGQG